MTNKTPVTLTVFSDFVCPWCYLASAASEMLTEKDHAVKIDWLPFPLHPSTPPEGMLLSELFPSASVDSMHERLYSLMDQAGLPYDPARDKIYNTRLAQELSLWAQDQDAGERVNNALFKAYFVENRNIGDQEVLLEIINECQLDRDAASEVLADRRYGAQVDQCWQQARDMQVSGVPCTIGGQYMMGGYQPCAELENFVAHLRNQPAVDAP